MADSICIAHGEPLDPGHGGSVRVVSLASSLADHGYDVHLVAPKSAGPSRREIENVTVHPVRITSRGAVDQLPRAVLVTRRAKSVAATHDATLQIERGTLAGVATVLGLSGFVVDLHDIGYNGPLYSNLPLSPVVKRFVYTMERRGVQRASGVVAVSDRMAEFVHSEWDVSEERIHVVPNGVRTEVFELEPPGDEIEGQVSFIGSLNYNIDYEKIVRLASELEDVEIHVIGDGYKREDLEDMVQREELENVVVHGFLPDEEAYRILGRSQVCIFPLVDTHHTKVAQHMKGFDYGAVGKPIATDRDGTARILEANDAALVSDPANPEEFVANVRRLLADEGLRSELGANARELAEEYRWENQGEKLVALYERGF